MLIFPFFLFCLFDNKRPRTSEKILMAKSIVTQFPALKDTEGEGYVSIIGGKESTLFANYHSYTMQLVASQS